MNRTLPRQTTNTIAASCILLNCLGVFAYLATFFNWNLSPEKAVNGDELMDPVPLLIMVGCACVILLVIVLQMTGIRLGPSKSAQSVVRYLCPVNLGWRKANESKLIFTLDLLGIRRGRPNNGHLFPKNAECWDGFRLKRSFTKARLAVIKAGLTTIITTITTKDREAIYG